MATASKLLRRSYLLALAPDEQEEALAELGEQLFVRVIARSLAILSDHGRERLTALLEAGAEGGQVATFLSEHVPDIANVISEEAASLSEDRASLLPDPGLDTEVADRYPSHI